MSKELNKAPAEQAGGDERDFQAKGAQEVPSPVSKEYDRHLISLLRKGEALPGHQEEAADEIERLRDWNDHLNNTVLPNILNPNFLMLMKGGERLLDLCTKDGKFIGVSLNDMKDVFDWMVTHARIAPDHAALAQPSPASDLDPLNLAPHAEAFNEAPDEALKPEQAEAERPEVVAWRYGFSGGIVSDKACLDEWKSGGEYQSLMTVAQHERIVGALRYKAELYDEVWALVTGKGYMNVTTAISVLESERDAALAEVERLRESKGDPSGSFDRCMKMMYERDENAKRLDAALARVAELEKQEPAGAPMPDEIHQMAFEEGQPAEDGDGYLFSAEEFDLFVQRLLDSCAAPVAQPEEMPGEILAAKLIETWVTKHGKPAPWSTAVEITALATNMPNDERDRLLALDDDVDAQAQHSVPGNAAALVRAEGKKYSLNAAGMLDSGAPEHAQTFAIVQLLSEFDDEEAESHWEAIMAYSDFRTSDALFHAAELLAAAPGKEVGHE
ncbi:hypothetical protein [Pseudomonas aeruginosa]